MHTAAFFKFVAEILHAMVVLHICCDVAAFSSDGFTVESLVVCVQEVVIVGGLEMQQQAKALARRPHVVVATPGRLKVSMHWGC